MNWFADSLSYQGGDFVSFFYIADHVFCLTADERSRVQEIERYFGNIGRMCHWQVDSSRNVVSHDPLPFDAAQAAVKISVEHGWSQMNDVQSRNRVKAFFQVV